MISPMMTVVVLAVLWLIVVIPMLIKRNDDRAGERSVARFSTAMRSLSARRSLASLARPVAEDEQLGEPGRRRASSHAQVFVPGGLPTAPVARKPVPAAVEALMYSDRIAKADMSEARREMMARRRRSLGLLIAGAVVGLLWGMVAGGMLAWTFTLLCLAGLAGYVTFLRNNAVRDRERRESRIRRSGLGQSRGYDATEQDEFGQDGDTLAYQYRDQTAVRIDDDDVALFGVADTIDLTGLYHEDGYDERSMRRAV